MKTKLCDVNPAALDKLPHLTDDKSGIGVHYVDAFLKPMNAQLADGTLREVQAPRAQDRALGRRQEGGGPDAAPGRSAGDPVVMLAAALKEAASAAGVELTIEDGAIFIAV